MEFSIYGYKFRLELVILSMLLGGFIGVNMFCSCAGGVKGAVNVVGSTVKTTMDVGTKMTSTVINKGLDTINNL